MYWQDSYQNYLKLCESNQFSVSILHAPRYIEQSNAGEIVFKGSVNHLTRSLKNDELKKLQLTVEYEGVKQAADIWISNYAYGDGTLSLSSV